MLIGYLNTTLLLIFSTVSTDVDYQSLYDDTEPPEMVDDLESLEFAIRKEMERIGAMSEKLGDFLTRKRWPSCTSNLAIRRMRRSNTFWNMLAWIGRRRRSYLQVYALNLQSVNIQNRHHIDQLLQKHYIQV